ncbi:hypothetical protein D3C86_1780940 [compost metagenome]
MNARAAQRHEGRDKLENFLQCPPARGRRTRQARAQLNAQVRRLGIGKAPRGLTNLVPTLETLEVGTRKYKAEDEAGEPLLDFRLLPYVHPVARDKVAGGKAQAMEGRRPCRNGGLR